MNSCILVAHLEEVLSVSDKGESIERLPRAGDAAAGAVTHLDDTETAARGISDAAFPPRRHVFIMARSSSAVIVFRWLQREHARAREKNASGKTTTLVRNTFSFEEKRI
jgi:hypothetical protein